MTNQIKYNWASLGTGVIANELAQALEALGGKLYSVANRTYDKGVRILISFARPSQLASMSSVKNPSL